MAGFERRRKEILRNVDVLTERIKSELAAATNFSVGVERGRDLIDDGSGIWKMEDNGTRTYTIEINGGATNNQIWF